MWLYNSQTSSRDEHHCAPYLRQICTIWALSRRFARKYGKLWLSRFCNFMSWMCDEDERKNDKSWRGKLQVHAILHVLPDESWAAEAACTDNFSSLFSHDAPWHFFSFKKLDVRRERRLRFHSLRVLCVLKKRLWLSFF